MFLLSVRPVGFSGSTVHYTCQGEWFFKTHQPKKVARLCTQFPACLQADQEESTTVETIKPVFMHVKVRLCGPSQQTSIAFHYLRAVCRAPLAVLGAWGGFGISSGSLCRSSHSAQLRELSLSQPFTKEKSLFYSQLQWLSRPPVAWPLQRTTAREISAQPASPWSSWWWQETNKQTKHITNKKTKTKTLLLNTEAIFLVFNNVLYRNWVSETRGEFSTSLS